MIGFALRQNAKEERERERRRRKRRVSSAFHGTADRSVGLTNITMEIEHTRARAHPA